MDASRCTKKKIKNIFTLQRCAVLIIEIHRKILFECLLVVKVCIYDIGVNVTERLNGSNRRLVLTWSPAIEIMLRVDVPYCGFRTRRTRLGYFISLTWSFNV